MMWWKLYWNRLGWEILLKCVNYDADQDVRVGFASEFVLSWIGLLTGYLVWMRIVFAVRRSTCMYVQGKY